MTLPVKHPLFNLREVCKQCVLLEDHLNCPGKQCPDCIRKHFLTIEGLFEEAASLDTDRQWDRLINGKPDLIRLLETRWIDGVDPRAIARILRAIRKALSPRCFDLRPMGKTAGEASSLVRHIAETHTLRTADAHATFDVFLQDLAGKFADWAVRQSPYDVPADLGVAIKKLCEWFRPRTTNFGGFENLKVNQHTLEKDLLKAFEAIPEIAAWNERRNGNQAPYKFTSMYDGPGDPDDDFVDLYALARNVAHNLWAEWVLGDVDMSQFPRAKAAGSNPVRTLRVFLDRLHRRALKNEDIATSSNRQALAKMLQDVDEALTGKTMPGRPPYDDYAKSLLDLNLVVMHLADGGYSRITVSILDPPHLWGHSSNQDTVKRNWEMLK